jgi:hypothetical protein
MPTAKSTTNKAAARSTITSLLRSSQSKHLSGSDVTGANAAERGSQPRDASRPPDAPDPLNTSNNNVDKYQKALLDIDTIRTALETRDGAASIPPALLRNLLDEAEMAFRNLHQNKEEEPSMHSILEEVRAVHDSVRSLPTPPSSPRQSWAQTVAATLPSTPTSPPRPAPQQQTYEITIRIADPAERETATSTPNEVIIQKIQQTTPEAKGIVAVRKLPSGDVRIFLASEVDKKALLLNKDWTKCLGQSCSATEQLFQVVVHSVRLDSLDPAKAADLTNLQEQNQTLHPNLRISRAKWLKPQYSAEQVHASLVLGLPSAEMADRVIQRGLVSSFTLHLVEYYSPSFRITQCFKCQGYGHIATNCRKGDTCGHCAQSHRSQDCEQKEQHKCANCGRRHPAWSGECKARMTAKTRSLQARHSAPSLHGNRDNSSSSTTSHSEGADWRTVESRKRKHSPTPVERKRSRPGRPPAVQTSNPSSQRHLSFGAAKLVAPQPLTRQQQVDSEMIDDE